MFGFFWFILIVGFLIGVFVLVFSVCVVGFLGVLFLLFVFGFGVGVFIFELKFIVGFCSLEVRI